MIGVGTELFSIKPIIMYTGSISQVNYKQFAYKIIIINDACFCKFFIACKTPSGQLKYRSFKDDNLHKNEAKAIRRTIKH